MVNGTKYDEKLTCKIAQQLLRAINHCHVDKVTHRDIKPENVIINSKGNSKLIDFGLSKNATAQQILKSMAGTPFYMAPEILCEKTYNEKVDIWSLGVLFYTMLCGYRPFDGNTAEEVFKSAQEGKFKLSGKQWGKVSRDSKNLICKMLELNPKKRISAKKAIEHPWFGLITDIKIRSAVLEEEKIEGDVLERLCAYKSVHQLRKALLNVLVKMLKSKETKEITDLFNKLDKDKTGYI